MGLFGSKPKLKIHRQEIDPSFRGVRPKLGRSLEDLLGGGGEIREELQETFATPLARFKAMLEGGDYYGPYRQRALDVAMGQTGRGAEAYMGGFDPAQQRAATVAAYEKNAPEAIKQVLTQAGLQAPGITHGRVREEAGRTAGNLYDEYQRALAEQNLQSAQFARGAEQLAATERDIGAGHLSQWGDITGEQARLAQMMGQLRMLPWEAQMQLMQPALQFDPWRWTAKEQGYMQPGQQGALGGLMGGLGKLLPAVGSMFGPLGTLAGMGVGGLMGGMGGGSGAPPWVNQ